MVSPSEILRSGADLEAWRNYIQQLNQYLAGHPSAQPRSLSNEETEFLTRELLLDKAEVSELASTAFTPLDIHYLEQAGVLRDAARAWNVADQTPLDRARNSFAWVVRQVRLQQAEGPVVPPLLVLRRGWGTARERALVFLALLDQLGIDGCMVAVPTDMSEQSQFRDWVPGALIDRQVYLFDTRLGLPLPGPDGKGIATLAQVRAGLDLRQLLNVQDKYPYDVGPETARHAQVQVAYSLSSLAPRMQFLQNSLASTEKITLWVDPVARWNGFREAAGAVRVWNTTTDGNNSLRVLRAFLPPEEGGIDQQHLREEVRRQVVPWQYFPQQLLLSGNLKYRLQALFAAPFIYFSLEPRMPRDFLVAWLPGLSEMAVDKPGLRKPPEDLLRSSLPRDLMVRGRSDEAIPLLVLIHGELQRQKSLSAPKLEEAVQRWSKKVIAAEADLSRAEQAGAAGALADAKAQVDRLWTIESAPVNALLQKAAADPMLERVVYLLALCKQEHAERLQFRHDQAGRQSKSVSPSDAKELTAAWKSASGWWQTYLSEYGAAPAAPAARLFRARALEVLGECAPAATLLEDLNGIALDLEKTGRLYLVKQLKGR